jgi:hypothetical protein
MKNENADNQPSIDPLTSTEGPDSPEPQPTGEPAPKSVQNTKWYKKKIFLASLVVLVLLGFGATTWALTHKAKKTEIQNTKSTNANNSQSNTQVSDIHKVAYIFAAKMWVGNADGQNTKELSKSNSLGDLKALYNWSPDNKVVLAQVTPDTPIGSKPGEKDHYVLIDTQNGSATKLSFSDDVANTSEPEDVNSNFVWTTNNTLAYVSNNNEVHQVDSNAGNKTLSTLPKHDFVFLDNKSISSDGQNVFYAGYYSGTQAPRFSGKVYVYNIKTGSDKLVTDQATSPLGWSGSSVAYVKDNKVYFYNLQTGKEQVSMDLHRETINTSADSISNPSIFAYSYFSSSDSRSYLEILNTTTKQDVYSNKLNSSATIALGGFTKDGGFFAYTVNDYTGGSLSQKANTLDVKTKTVHQLCKGGYTSNGFVGFCQSPVLSN